jgi:ketopantoate reductase PanE/ApbA-like protein
MLGAGASPVPDLSTTGPSKDSHENLHLRRRRDRWLLGVQLARAGVDVSLVARGAQLSAMRENGLKLLIDDEVRVAHPRCTDNPAELGPQDYVIICRGARADATAAGAAHARPSAS